MKRWSAPLRLRDAAPLVIAVAVIAAGVIEAVLRPTGNAWTVIGALGMTIPVLWCRRYPISAVVVGFGTLVLEEGFGGDVTSQGYGAIIALLIISYSAGRRTRGRGAVVAAGLLLVLTWASIPFGDDQTAVSMIFSFVITGFISLGPWLAGVAIRDREDRLRQLTELSNALARERDQRVQDSVELERARIARELHDVLAHSVTAMVVQAEAAEELLTRQPEHAVESLHRIQHTGRTALDETRRVLHQLRGSEPHRLDDLKDLIAEANESGLNVLLRVEGTPRALSTDADISAYRIVQEALTNVRKHANAQQAEVVLKYEAHGLEIEVTDDGTATKVPEAGGLGLLGMRERAEQHGGELYAGTREGGGFAVLARLPLRSANA